jgi:hypothetical protein
VGIWWGFFLLFKTTVRIEILVRKKGVVENCRLLAGDAMGREGSRGTILSNKFIICIPPSFSGTLEFLH